MSESLKLSLSTQSINDLVQRAKADSTLTSYNPVVQLERSDGSNFEYMVSFVDRKVAEVTDSGLDFFVEHEAIDDESEIICLINKLLDQTLFEETAHTSKEDHAQKQVFALKECTESSTKHVGFKEFILQDNPQKHSEPILTNHFYSKLQPGFNRSVSMGEQQKNGYHEPADLKDWANQASKRVDEIGYQLKLHLDVKDVLFSEHHNEVSFPEELPISRQENRIYYNSQMFASIKTFVTLGHKITFIGVKKEWEGAFYLLLLRVELGYLYEISKEEQDFDKYTKYSFMFSKRDLLVTKAEVGAEVSDIVCVGNEFPFTENSSVQEVKLTDSNQAISVVDEAAKLSNLTDKLKPEPFELKEKILYESEYSDDDEPNVDLPPANEAELQLENEDELQFGFLD